LDENRVVKRGRAFSRQRKKALQSLIYIALGDNKLLFLS